MIILNHEQGTEEWLDAKMGKPSGTGFNKIIQPDNMIISKQREAYLYDLCEERFEVKKDFYKSRYMERGSGMEPEARNYYAFLRDIEPQQVGFCTDDDGRYGVSPDFLIGDDGGCEVKCPKLITHRKYAKAETLPNEYKLQVLGALLVTGRDWWDFMSYFPGTKPYIFRVCAEDYREDINTLRIAVELFCDDLDKLEKEMRQ